MCAICDAPCVKRYACVIRVMRYNAACVMRYACVIGVMRYNAACLGDNSFAEHRLIVFLCEGFRALLRLL